MSTTTKVPGSTRGGNARGRGSARAGVASAGGDHDAREGIKNKVESALSTQVSQAVFHKGLYLYLTGHLVQNSTYPWIYMVSSARGDQVYRVDLSEPSCGCKGFEITGKICKHVVAAGAKFLDGGEGA